MKNVALDIIALSNSESHPGSYVVVLKEQKGEKRLPIIIGSFEAQAIALALQGITTKRPLTHDLFKTVIQESGLKINKVVIAEIKDGVFYSLLIGKKIDGTSFEVDTRTSDALALAIRFGCPIYTTNEVIEEAGITLDEEAPKKNKELRALDEYTVDELKDLLQKVLSKEDYETASQIRDEINRKLADK